MFFWWSQYVGTTMIRRIARFSRMTGMLLSNRISWSSYVLGLRQAQVAVCAKRGGMLFCERATERMFFS